MNFLLGEHSPKMAIDKILLLSGVALRGIAA